MQSRDHLPSKYARLSWSLVVQVVIFPHLSGEGCQLDFTSAVPPHPPPHPLRHPRDLNCKRYRLQCSPPGPNSKHRIRVFPAGTDQCSPPDLNLRRYTRQNARKNVRRYARQNARKNARQNTRRYVRIDARQNARNNVSVYACICQKE